MQRGAPKPGSVGAALPGIEIRLVDEAGASPRGRGPRRDPVRGDNLFSGYWPDGADGPDADGWWATGDVGFLDADGDLFLVDRLKELVIVSGLQRLPERGRGRRSREVDGVAEAAVIGVAGRRAPARRSSPTCRRARRRRTPRPSSTSAVREHCAVRLARFKQPTEVHVVDELPHTVTGKVRKGRLRASERRPRAGAAGVSDAAGHCCTPSPGCHLCDDARVVVEQVCAELGESYAEVDITADPEPPADATYGEEIPVTFVDGRQHDFWRVDADRLRAALGYADSRPVRRARPRRR